jgi:hypothetical protein
MTELESHELSDEHLDQVAGGALFAVDLAGPFYPNNKDHKLLVTFPISETYPL